ARGDASRESDIDLLIVGDNLPQSRFDRIRLFDEVERSIEKELKKIEEEYGVTISFSPIIKSVEEARRFTPLYLDLVEDAVILYDKNNFMENILEKLRRRLRELGAVRVWRGRRWYWILKPEIKVGEVVEIE
ncbi:MAG: nucleotidyltransferase domain-containing protein, partial [Nitrososphaerota archaeon]